MSLLNLKIQQKKYHPRFSVKDFFRAYLVALKTKALFFTYSSPASKKLSNFLVCLEKNGRIAGYKVFPKNQEIKIFLNYDENKKKPHLPKVIYYSSQGRTRTISVKILEQFKISNPNALVLVHTHRGIMDLKSCLFQKCGGQILVTLV